MVLLRRKPQLGAKTGLKSARARARNSRRTHLASSSPALPPSFSAALPSVRRCGFWLQFEGEEEVSGHAGGYVEAGSDVNHIAHDNGPGAADRAAVRGDSVDGLEIGRRVEVPDDLAVVYRIGTQMAVHRR